MRGEGRIQPGEPGTVVLRMAPRPENLALARLALAGVGTVAGAGESDIADLKLAVTEACTNAILHAYSDGASGRARRSLPRRFGRRRHRGRGRRSRASIPPIRSSRRASATVREWA